MSIWRPVVECAEEEQLRSLQSRRFGESLSRLATAPFYHGMLEGAGVSDVTALTLADLPHLPLTCKRDLLEQPPLSLLAVPRTEVARIHATTQPLLVALTRRDVANWSDVAARIFSAAGCQPGDVWYITTVFGRLTGGLGAQQGAELVGATVIPSSHHQPQRIAALMREIPPTGIHCAPAFMLRLAEALQDQGLDPAASGLRAGALGGESYSPHLRETIERVFQMRVFDVYGLAEFLGPGVAYECEADQGMHISEDHFLVEILDPIGGLVLPPGEEGEVVITSLTREAMPLLRYRTGDRSRLLTGVCPCGRTTRRLDRISAVGAG